MPIFRRAAGVALFDRKVCREILYDPRAIYQGLAVLAAGLAASTIWALVEPSGSHGPLSSAEDPGTRGPVMGSDLWQVAVGQAAWAAAVVVIMVAGRWIMGAPSTPGWRGLISLWSFASAPWVAVALLSSGLSVIG
jgi:hypothetical protein